MDLKSKLISFLTDKKDVQINQNDDDATNDEWINDSGVVKLKQHCTQSVQDPRIDKEAIESIDKCFFSDEPFDAAKFQLAKFLEPPNHDIIESMCAVLKTQLQAVSRKISELVLENHPSYSTELERVMELQRSLERAVATCSHGRRSLSETKQNFTGTSLKLLANYKKKRQLILVSKSLHTIKTLQRTDNRLKELLKEEDYPGAIQLSLEYQKAAETYKHYRCISDLSLKLQDKLDMIDEALDVALSKTCCGFDVHYYSRIQQAYRLLGKTQMAIDQLLMHYTSIVHNTAFTKILGYVELCSSSGNGSFQKRQFPDLCKFIKAEVFMPCLFDLCRALWEVVLSYKKTIDWHTIYDNEDILLSRSSSAVFSSERSQPKDQKTKRSSINVQQLDVTTIHYIRNKLEVGRSRIWGEVQQKIKVFLSSIDLSTFKYEEFIKVLDVVNRLMRVGEEFCQSKSEGLEESMRMQSTNYFKNYHQSRLDELKMFMENESWEICPVKDGFSIFMLQEFKFMKGQGLSSNCTFSSNNDESLFERFVSRSPFDDQPDDDEVEDVLEDGNSFVNEFRHTNIDGGNSTDSDDDIPEELKRDFVDEGTGEVNSSCARTSQRLKRQTTRPALNSLITTNTTLNVCRVFGKYVQMLSVLKSISYDVVCCMTQLMDYYLFTVYNFFTSDVDKFSENDLLSSKFRASLKRIRDDLLAMDNGNEDVNFSGNGGRMDKVNRVGVACLSPVVRIDNSKDLFGLKARIIATESLIFLMEQFKLLQPHLDQLMPPAKKNFLQQYAMQTLNVAWEVRRPVYRVVVSRSLDLDSCLLMMSSVKWDVKDIMSQHSEYVDSLLQEINYFHNKLLELSKHFSLPISVNNCLWEHVSRLSSQMLVEGYSSVKKCTNEGRALMMLDFQQFLIKLEKFTSLRPIPGREYVEAYIKAFYLPESQLEAWILEKKDYTPKQLTSLISCLGHVSKKTKQRLSIMIDESADRFKR